VWIPTLHKSGEGWGTHGMVSNRKSRKDGAPGAFARAFLSLRYAARRPAAQGRILFLAYPALTPSARKRASGRAGLTCRRAYGASFWLPWQCRSPCVIPRGVARYVSQRGCGIVRYEENQMWCDERCVIPPFARAAKDGTPTVMELEKKCNSTL
jgi:hypothetical protein